jgi:hypothetical protein
MLEKTMSRAQGKPEIRISKSETNRNRKTEIQNPKLARLKIFRILII